MKINFKILCIASCVLCLVSCFTAQAYAYEYSRSLDGALSLMLRGEYVQAIDACRSLELNAKNDLKSEILYLQGNCFMKLDRQEDARVTFKKALPFARGDLATELYMSIADTYFLQKKYQQAIVIYEQMLTKTKNEDAYMCTLYYKLGKAYQNESEWAKTKYYFGLLEKKFPDSFELAVVKRTSVGGNFFTVQVGCFSNRRNAEKLQADLRDKGYEVYITPFQANGSELYRVRVGEFMSRLAAEHSEAELQSKEHLPTHIFP